MVSDDDPMADHFANEAEAEELAMQGNGCSGMLPRYLSISGAGCADINGVFEFTGIHNHRPYYSQKLETSHTVPHAPAIWYFSSCPLARTTNGNISYNGWYISREVATSSYSASNDMYSIYSHTSHVPLDSDNWIVRERGLGPISGCGLKPAPLVSVAAGYCSSSAQIMILRISLPTGRLVSLPVSEHETVQDVKRWIDIKFVTWRTYEIILKVRNRVLANTSIILSAVSKGDIVIAEPRGRAEISTTSLKSRKILVIGAGPVGTDLISNVHIRTI